MESPEACENDADKKMATLSPQECRDMDFTCFESRLNDSNINTDQVKRVSSAFLTIPFTCYLYLQRLISVLFLATL